MIVVMYVGLFSGHSARFRENFKTPDSPTFHSNFEYTLDLLQKSIKSLYNKYINVAQVVPRGRVDVYGDMSNPL